MYLKSIEVHGFKSFAQKINFEFHNGITGIVGPERKRQRATSAMQSAGFLVNRVRSSFEARNMQDVIFSGTELEKAAELCVSGHHPGQ